MKLSIELQADQVLKACEFLEEKCSIIFESLNVEEKINTSISFRLLEILNQKKMLIMRNNGLFTNTKIKIFFHEAIVLKKVLMNNVQLIENDLLKLNIQSFINALDKKTPEKNG
ncbi:hypothetical protein [uncultured Tenacibaculum sp.]|uniref:hypothetical protein n=1 Tax=uncultured Tenacibaculum sp. TaxID=174713 RepID=UPI0026299270|nr:hypothetical protein [uncultured Tenacibaculum sp.]